MTPQVYGLAFLDMFGGPEIILILVAVLIFFGGEKMPDFARGLGKAIREVKKAAAEVENEFKRAIDENERAAQARPELPPIVPNPDAQSAHTVSLPPAPPHVRTQPPEGHYEDPIE